MWTLIVVEDDPDLCQHLVQIAGEVLPFVSHSIGATTYEAAIKAIDRASAAPDRKLLVLADFGLRHAAFTGLDVLAHAQRARPASVRILMSGRDRRDIQSPIEPRGVHAFFQKPFLLHELAAFARSADSPEGGHANR